VLTAATWQPLLHQRCPNAWATRKVEEVRPVRDATLMQDGPGLAPTVAGPTGCVSPCQTPRVVEGSQSHVEAPEHVPPCQSPRVSGSAPGHAAPRSPGPANSVSVGTLDAEGAVRHFTSTIS
jgi:hypothetical protein